MLKSKLRLLGVSALVGAGLIATGPASAYNVRLGNVDVQIDTSLAVGASWKMKDSNTNHLALANGGNLDNRPVISLLGAAGALGQGVKPSAAVKADGVLLGTASDVAAGCAAYTTICLNLGASEAGAVNGLYQSAVAAATRAATAGTQKEKDAAAATAVAAIPAADLAAGGPINYDASINGDDGRLNFEKGDMFSQSSKFLTEVEASMGNIRGFMRVSGFYDSVLDDDDSFERSKGGILDQGRDEAVTDLQILDAFIDYDTNIGGIPVLVRVGSQVINWGESTFFGGGNSVFNPIDVPAIRRPGAEIKDALLPVEAAYVSASLTQDITVEAYFGGHDKFKLDVGGTHFANSDNLVPGSGKGGNNGIFYVGGSRGSGSNKWNLDDTGVGGTAAATGLMKGTENVQTALRASTTHPARARTATHAQHYSTLSPIGELESFRKEWEDTNQVKNLGALDADEDSMGIALRYYAENLNSTEFGFYYQKYTSRIPYVGYRSNKPNVGVGTVSNSTSAVTASLSGRSACSRNYMGVAAAGPQAGAFTTDVADGITIGNDASDDIKDMHGSWAVVKAAAQQSYTDLSDTDVHRHYHTVAAATISGFLQSAAGGGLAAPLADAAARHYTTVDATRDAADFAGAGSLLYGALSSASAQAAFTETVANKATLGLAATTILGGMLKASAITAAQFADMTNAADTTTGNRPYEAADFTADTITGAAWFAAAGIGNPTGDTYTDLMDANCLLGIENSAADGNSDADWYGDYALGGSTQPSINYSTDLFTYYPEDIEAYGVSFNTTAFGWGIQGEVAFRPDMPLLVDTDSTFIAAASDQCAFPLSGDAGTAVYAPLVTHGTICDATVGGADIFGHVELDVFNWDIGTTATYTRSNPIVAALRADLGVILTELGGVMVPDIEDTYAKAIDPATGKLSGKDQIKRLQGICTAGSDLPLGGLLDLDAVAINSCRPTENSSGGLLLTSLQYNNVFGTPWGLTPTLIIRGGFHGYSPSPAGSFREGVGSTSFSLRADYQGYLSVALSYTDFTGNDKYTKSEDQDFASLSVNYAF